MATMMEALDSLEEIESERLKIITELANMDPWLPRGDIDEDDDRYCYFCDVWEDETHAENCLWERANKTVGRA